MRLGLALHKTIGEIRTMPAAEFKRWQAFYLLEPFGWENQEFLAAHQMSQLVNLKIEKFHNKTKPADFMRDLQTAVPAHIAHEIARSTPKYDLATEEGRLRAEEEVLKNLEVIFGPIKKKEK